jgi:hypothetical protein
MKPTLESAISSFGAVAKQKLSNPSSTGEPEDQLRAPFEQLLKDMADLSGFVPSHITAIGEILLRDLKTPAGLIRHRPERPRRLRRIEGPRQRRGPPPLPRRP